MAAPRVSQLVLVLAAGIAALGLWLYHGSPRAEAARDRAEALSQGAPASAAPRVRVDALVLREARSPTIVDVAGLLEARRRVVVGAELGGRVIEVAAEEHGHVATGELLVRLDPALPEAAVSQARARLQSARAASRLAAAELARRRELSERGVASAAELERIESEESTAAAAVAEARAALRDAETRLAKTRITAPFDAVVSSLELEPGAYLQPGSPVAELADLGEVEIEVGVGDAEILEIAPGDRVEVAVDAFPGECFEGRVLRPGRVAAADTGKYPVPIRIANPDERLLPGMLGSVRFELGAERPALRIPRAALQREFELAYVFVLESRGEEAGQAVARRRRVTTRPLPFRPELLEVSEGLAPGERIAISGVRELREGLVLNFVERELPL